MPDKSTVVVLINVFTVEPANQERLVALLARATDGSIDTAPPGFHSATLHRSIDGTKVTMYAKWRSAEASPRNATTFPMPVHSSMRPLRSPGLSLACTK